MAGYFILELDTTQPIIEIYSPSYTTNSNEIEITVTADEILSDGFQDFYIIDQYGVRHNYIFTYNGNSYYGKMTLSNFDNGFVTFYAQVKDEVDNLSQLSSVVIEVIPSVNYLRLDISDSISVRSISTINNTRNLEQRILEGTKLNLNTNIKETQLDIGNKQREVSIISKSRKIETTTKAVI